MPELPEVETIRRGLAPHLDGRAISGLLVRDPRLRWPLATDLAECLAGQRIEAVRRRGKYLLLVCGGGHLLIHLGMSGSLRVLDAALPAQKHDHLDILLDDGRAVRYRDPRRFGCVLWTAQAPERHPLLADLGPEPLGPEFSGEYLHARSRRRVVAVKPFLMDSHVVVGVGNIYASESLFLAGIHPARPAGEIGVARYLKLAAAVRETLGKAIAQGGTTLRDFADSEGRPGYFQLSLHVYGRAGEACPRCGTPIRQRILGQRASYFCPRCQR